MNNTIKKILVLFFLLLLIDDISFSRINGVNDSGATIKKLLEGDNNQYETEINLKLDWNLWNLEQFHKQNSYSKTQPRKMDWNILPGEMIAIIIVVDTESNTKELEISLQSLGVKVEGSYNHFLQVKIPLIHLDRITNLPGVYIKTPNTPISFAISEGVDLTKANEYHIAGYNGQGVKIAVLDEGFHGYENLLGTDLPNGLITKSFYGDPSGENGVFPGSTYHGTACAEIVYDMAPDSTLYLVNSETIVELGAAVNWLIDQEVDIISYSVGWANEGPYDGTGPICDIIDHARQNGILWVTAAGNMAKRHYEGFFFPTEISESNPYAMNSNYMHDFQNPNPAGDGNSADNFIQAKADDRIDVYLSWNDWTNCTINLELRLLEWDSINKSYHEVAVSNNPQNGYSGQQPTEKISLIAPSDSWYVIRIESNDPVPPECYLELFSFPQNMNYYIKPGSLINPANSPTAISVGAIGKDKWENGILKSYSSQGPTNGPGGDPPSLGGRIKPDLCGPTDVSVEILTVLGGTSAATPHVAGAAALLMSRYPHLSLTDYQNLLEQWAVDLGDPGKDNLFGSGRLTLKQYAEDVNNDGVVNILDLVVISIHFGRQVSDGLDPSWTSIGDDSIPDRADVNDDGVVNVLDMVRVSIAFD